MKISYNAAAMRASNALNASDSKVSRSLGRLSSGLKVTASKDNPSGYAIGRRMNTQITGIGSATQNSNNGISVIETADGALTEVHEMLQRMNELAVKGETGTLTTTDRMTLEAEVKQLKQEITRISTDTQFNGQTLLDGTFDLRGYTNDHRVKVDYYSDEVIAKKYTIEELNLVYGAMGRIDKDATTITLGEGFPAGVEVAETTKTKITLKGPQDFEMTIEIPKDKDGNRIEGNIIEEGTVTVPTFNPVYDFTYDVDGTPPGWTSLGLNKEATAAALKDAAAGSDIPTDLEVSSVTREGDKDIIVFKNDSGFELTLEVSPADAPNNQPADPTDPKQLTVQIEADPAGGGAESYKKNLVIDITGLGTMDIQTGANEGQQLAIRIPTISLARMNLEDLRMTTSEECAEANKAIKSAILYVSDARSRLGAYQNRLEHTVNNLAVSNENMTASYSRIMDVDMAEEMTNYTTEQVISQAAVSMLAQANERPSQVLQLLQ